MTGAAYRPDAARSGDDGAPMYAHIPPEHFGYQEIKVDDKALIAARDRLTSQGIYVPNLDSGFSAHLYVSQDPSQGLPPLIAFRGTDAGLPASDLGMADARTDLKIATGQFDAQFANALLFYEAAKPIITRAEYDPNNLIFTGHSLGGGLAAIMANYTGHEAVTVNPAPNQTIATRMRNGLYFSNKPSYGFPSSSFDLKSPAPGQTELPPGSPAWAVLPAQNPPGHVRNYILQGEIVNVSVNNSVVQSDALGVYPGYVGELHFSEMPHEGVGAVSLHSPYLVPLLLEQQDRLKPLAEKVPELLSGMLDHDATRMNYLNTKVPGKGYREDMFVQQLIRDDFMKGPMSQGFLADMDKLAVAGEHLDPEIRFAMVQAAVQYAALEGNKGPQASAEGVIQLDNGILSVDVGKFPPNEPVAAVSTLRAVLSPAQDFAATLPSPQKLLVATTQHSGPVMGTNGNDWIFASSPQELVIPAGGADVIRAARDDHILMSSDMASSVKPISAVAQGNIVAAGFAAQSGADQLTVLSEKMPDGTRQAPMRMISTGVPIAQILPTTHGEMAQGADEMGNRSEVKRIAIERTGGPAQGHLIVLPDGSVQPGSVPFKNNPQIAAGKNGETLGILYEGKGRMNEAQACTLADVTSWLAQCRQHEGLSHSIEVIAGLQAQPKSSAFRRHAARWSRLQPASLKGQKVRALKT